MWFIFTLATTLLWGLAELFYKKGSHENEKYDHLRVCIMVGANKYMKSIFKILQNVVRQPANNHTGTLGSQFANDSFLCMI